jgi:hypothetical protein
MMLPMKAFSTPITPVVHCTALPVSRLNLLLWNLHVMQGPPASSVISPAVDTGRLRAGRVFPYHKDSHANAPQTRLRV